MIHSRTTGTAETAETLRGHPRAPDLGVHRLALEVGGEPGPVRLEHEAAVLGGAENRLGVEHVERVVVRASPSGRLAQRHQRDAAIERRPSPGARSPSASATARAVLDFPEADGPSIAITPPFTADLRRRGRAASRESAGS